MAKFKRIGRINRGRAKDKKLNKSGGETLEKVEKSPDKDNVTKEDPSKETKLKRLKKPKKPFGQLPRPTKKVASDDKQTVNPENDGEGSESGSIDKQLERMDVGSFRLQMKACMIKIYLRKLRHWRLALFLDLGFPMLVLIALITVRHLDVEEHYDPVYKPPGSVNVLTPPIRLLDKKKMYSVYVSPDTKDVRTLFKEIEESSVLTALNITYMSNEEDSVEALKNDENYGMTIDLNGTAGNHLFYKIRGKSKTPLTLPSPKTMKSNPKDCSSQKDIEKREEEEKVAEKELNRMVKGRIKDKIPPMFKQICPVYNYYLFGFNTLQFAVDHAWLRLKNPKHIPPMVRVEILPKKGIVMVPGELDGIIPFNLMIMMTAFIAALLNLIVKEKETKIKESLKMVGLRTSVYWLSWFCCYFIWIFIIVLVTSILIRFLILKYTNFIIIFLMMLMYGTSIILLAFVFATCFQKAMTAAVAGVFLAVFMGSLFMIELLIEGVPTFVIYLVCLLSPAAFGFGITGVTKYDIDSSWDLDWWSGKISIAGSLLFMSFDCILYAAMTAYFDNVIPTDYGRTKEPFFCLRKEYWQKRKEEDRQKEKEEAQYDESKFVGDHIEEVPEYLKGTEAITIYKIKKKFKGKCGRKSFKAVRGISLKIYPNEVTAIIGQNGAGKTTLFNMLTGMTSVTSGSAVIYGLDVRNDKDMREIRRLSGVCPQHDVLFDELTVKEHLQFYGRLRGLTNKEIVKETNTILSEMNMPEKLNTRASRLSGGQKRKLSVGIALIGDPKLIFLDEPTAGVDPLSRRNMWSLLKAKKEGKVILLTTHFMDEADILADRKAIVSHGKVKCYGSSLFLKSKYGLGYHLTMVLDPKAGNLEATRALVQYHVKGSEQTRVYGREVSFLLPQEQINRFPNLFRAIEQDIEISQENAEDEVRQTKMSLMRGHAPPIPGLQKFGISSYGVSMTTLEEVFLLLGGDDEVGEDMKHKNMSVTTFESEKTTKRFWQTYLVLVYIRFLRRYRQITVVIFQLLVPILFIFVGLWIVHEAGQEWVWKYTERSIVLNQSVYYAMFSQSKHQFGFNNFTGHPLNVTEHMYNISDFNKTKPDYKGLLKSDVLAMFEFSQGAFETETNDGEDDKDNNGLGNDMGTLGLLKLKDLLKSAGNKTLNNATIAGLIAAAGGDTKIGNSSLSDLLRNKTLMKSIKNNPFISDKAYSVHIYVNDTKVHAIPIAINELSMGYAQMYSKKYNITTISRPIISQDFRNAKTNKEIQGAIFIGVAYALVSTGLALDLIEDREIRAKSLLRVNGVTSSMYYSSLYTVLGAMLLFLCLSIMCLVIIFDNKALATPASFFVLSSLYILMIIPALLYSSAISFAFDTVDSGFILYLLSLLIGYVPFNIVFFLYVRDIGENREPARYCHMFFLSWNIFYIPYAVVFYVGMTYMKEGCLFKDECDITVSNFTDHKEIYAMYISLVVQTIILIFVVRIVDVMTDGGTFLDAVVPPCFKLNRKNKKKNLDVISPEDDDVTDERKIVDKYFAEDKSTKMVATHALRKEFGKKRVAVRNLTFGVDAGDIFGMLGPNGAGKTTTMLMITAEVAPTCGQIKIGPDYITSNVSKGLQRLGYCPQFDALWKTVTVKEHLWAYGVIKGLGFKKVKKVTESFMEGLGLKEYENKYSRDCSGGTRRKVSYAISMMGDPEIVLLDEPTTGMDPHTKRFVWDTILANFKSSRGAILTTHYMEEADALCTKIGIMINGHLTCLGSAQHLKSKFGTGYTMEVKLRKDPTERDWDRFEKKLRERFPGFEVIEAFSDRKTFNIPKDEINSLATTFKFLENVKKAFHVEEYSFSQTSLEQVFLEFARHQDDEGSVKKSVGTPDDFD